MSLILLVGLAWVALSVVVGLFVGRWIAWGEGRWERDELIEEDFKRGRAA